MFHVLFFSTWDLVCGHSVFCIKIQQLQVEHWRTKLGLLRVKMQVSPLHRPAQLSTVCAHQWWSVWEGTSCWIGALRKGSFRLAGISLRVGFVPVLLVLAPPRCDRSSAEQRAVPLFAGEDQANYSCSFCVSSMRRSSHCWGSEGRTTSVPLWVRLKSAALGHPCKLYLDPV